MGGYSGNPNDVAAYNAGDRSNPFNRAFGMGPSAGRFGENVAMGGKLVGPGGPVATTRDATDAYLQQRKFAQMMGARMGNGMKSTFLSGPSGSIATGNVNYGLPPAGAGGKTLLGQ